MKNTLAEDWKKEQKNRIMYDAAKECGDEAGMDAARAAHRQLDEEIAAKGQPYGRIYRMYAEMRERGNDCIDFNECIWEKEIPELVNALRAFDICKFSLSATWSGTVNVAWDFQKHGCRLEGMREIKGHCKDFDSNDYEKVPAFIFCIE